MAQFKQVLTPTKTPVYKPPKAPAPKKGLPYDPSVFTYSPGNTAPGVPPTPAAATAPPPASGAPADTALPPDATYEQIIGALRRKRDATITGLAGQRTTTLLNYGYTEDPTTGALAYDPNNPESQAAQLKKHYDQSRSGTGINLAARGQLYAGSYQNAQDALNQGQLTDEDKMKKALQGYLAGNTSAKTGAQTDYEIDAGQAYGDRVGRAVAGDRPSGGDPPPAPPAAKNPLPGLGNLPLSTGFAGLDPNKRYRQASNGRLQIQNSNGTWRYV